MTDRQPEPVTYRSALAARLRSIAAGRGLSQDSIAERMQALGYKWHRQTVSTVFQGGRKLGVEELLGLALAFETSLSELIAPLTNSSQGTQVALPNGDYIPATEISTMAGAGVPSGWVRWDDNVPFFPSATLREVWDDGDDYTAKVREAMDFQGPSVFALTNQDEVDVIQDILRDVRMAAVDVLTDAQLLGAEPSRPLSAKERQRLRSEKADEMKRAIAEHSRRLMMQDRRPQTDQPDGGGHHQ